MRYDRLLCVAKVWRRWHRTKTLNFCRWGVILNDMRTHLFYEKRNQIRRIQSFEKANEHGINDDDADDGDDAAVAVDVDDDKWKKGNWCACVRLCERTNMNYLCNKRIYIHC